MSKLAFTISEFFATESEMTSSGVKIKVWTRYPTNVQAAYISEVAPKILEYFEDKFGLAYPFEKLDLFVAMDDMEMAMENWGLIIGGEDAMSDIAIVVHEIAHQWFGNLVTMEWWDK